MVEYLIRLLLGRHKIAVLSRGYKRSTKGFHLAEGEETYRTLGDEPLQYYNKWKSDLVVSVCEDRVEAIPKILFERPDTEIVIMDDGYQHRAISPDLKILLTDYTKPFFSDYLLPSGRLREPRKEARRADIVIVTKCPEDLTKEDVESFNIKIRKYTRMDIPIYFSTMKYLEPKPLFDWVPKHFSSRNVLAISGIANPIHFEKYIASNWKILNAWHYSDHYIYKPSDIKSLKEIWQGYTRESPVIVTTEKDATKFTHPDIIPHMEGLPVYVIGIEMEILEDGKEFDAGIIDAIRAKTGI